ncbi:hypothetical protein Tco_0720717 [Tanacetum coccineum]
MAQQPMRSEEELCPNDKRISVNCLTRKALGEGSSAAPDSLDHSYSFDNSIWDSTNDDKTKSEKDSDHGDKSFEIRAHDKEPEQPQLEIQYHSPSVTIMSQKDVSRYLNDPHEVQITELLNEPMYTETTTETVIPLLDSIHETQEDNPVDKVMKSTPDTTTTITPPTNLEEHEEKLNAHAQINHTKAIRDSVKANMPNFVPKVVSDFVLPRLERTVLDVIKKNPVNLFQSTRKSTVDPIEKSIPTRYFFNNDLEYLRLGNEEKKYALSVTKIKAARYEQEGIRELIPHLWSPRIYKYNRNAELGIYHWKDDRQWFYKGSIGHKSPHDVYSKHNIISVKRIKVVKKYEYGY